METINEMRDLNGTINKISLVGNVGRDPDMQTTASGRKVAQFPVVTIQRIPHQNGVIEERTEWHRITCWDRLAELAEEHIRKGDRVYIEGRMKYDSFEKNGVTIPTSEVHVHELVLFATGATG